MNIRPAVDADAASIWSITQEPSVRAASTRSEAFTLEQHMEWWHCRFNDSGQRFYVAEKDGYELDFGKLPREPGEDIQLGVVWVHSSINGYVRYGRVPNTQDAEIAIAVSPSARRSGVALQMLQETESLAAKDLGINRLIALVVVGNTASSKLFEKAGYRLVKWEERMKKMHQRWEKQV